jgi:hypothetical protein
VALFLYRNRISTTPFQTSSLNVEGSFSDKDNVSECASVTASQASSLNVEGSFSDKDNVSECASVESASSAEGDIHDQGNQERDLVGAGALFVGIVGMIRGSYDMKDLHVAE